VYAYDTVDQQKQSLSQQLLTELATRGLGVISSQVLAEFYVSTTRKIKKPLNPKQAETTVANFARIWTVVEVTSLIVVDAMRIAREHGLSYWDAQICATARANTIPVILSEDLHQRNLEGIQIANPFRSNFQISDYI
jgi:predicted nucleic acid-binding protein